MNRRLLATGAVLVALLTGCGTTVSGTTAAGDAANSGTTSSDALSAPSAGAVPGSTSAGSTASGVAGGSASSGQPLIPGHTGSVGSPGAGGTGTAGGTTGTGTAQKLGIGITPTTVTIGVVYTSGDDTANKALGNNLTTGDQQADGQAVIDDINAHGGVAGRKLKAVWYDYQETDSRPYTTIDSEACAKFTQDNHVFAVAGDGITDEFPACIMHAGSIMVASASGIIGPDQAYFEKYPYVFSVGYPAQDRMMAEEARSLIRQDY